MDRPVIIATDFDNTLSYGSYPNVGVPNKKLIQYLINCRKCGIKVILHTMREGALLAEAVKFCKAQGLEFDCINDNLPEMIELYGVNSRKIGADYYIDDRVALCGFGRKLPDLSKYRKRGDV